MTRAIEPWATPQPPEHFPGQLTSKIGPTITDHDPWYTNMGEQINQCITALAVSDFNI